MGDVVAEYKVDLPGASEERKEKVPLHFLRNVDEAAELATTSRAVENAVTQHEGPASQRKPLLAEVWSRKDGVAIGERSKNGDINRVAHAQEQIELSAEAGSVKLTIVLQYQERAVVLKKYAPIRLVATHAGRARQFLVPLAAQLQGFASAHANETALDQILHLDVTHVNGGDEARVPS